jgi:hypothetical protein
MVNLLYDGNILDCSHFYEYLKGVYPDLASVNLGQSSLELQFTEDPEDLETVLETIRSYTNPDKVLIRQEYINLNTGFNINLGHFNYVGNLLFENGSFQSISLLPFFQNVQGLWDVKLTTSDGTTVASGEDLEPQLQELFLTQEITGNVLGITIKSNYKMRIESVILSYYSLA